MQGSEWRVGQIVCVCVDERQSVSLCACLCVFFFLHQWLCWCACTFSCGFCISQGERLVCLFQYIGLIILYCSLPVISSLYLCLSTLLTLISIFTLSLPIIEISNPLYFSAATILSPFGFSFSVSVPIMLQLCFHSTLSHPHSQLLFSCISNCITFYWVLCWFYMAPLPQEPTSQHTMPTVSTSHTVHSYLHMHTTHKHTHTLHSQ